MKKLVVRKQLKQRFKSDVWSVERWRGVPSGVVAALLLAFCAPAGSQAEHRTALLIGNAGYADRAALASPVKDVKVVAAMLQKRGFHTKLATNLDRDGLYQAIDRFIKSAPIQGTALVYFRGYVLTSTSADKPPKTILLGIEGNRQGLPLTELLGWLALYSATARNVIVLDGDDTYPGDPIAPGTTGRPARKDLPADIWLGYAVGTDAAAGVDGPDENRPRAGSSLSAFARKFSTSDEARLDTLLTAACRWTRTTCPKPPFTSAASLAVGPPDAFPGAAKPGDEWVAPDGTVFCYCPPSPGGDGFWIGKYEVPRCKWPIPNSFAAVGIHRNDPTTRQRIQDVRAKLAAYTHDERKAGRLPLNWEYALPSSEQWEHAARAGSTGERYFPDTELVRHANFADKSLLETGDDYYSYADPTLNDGAAELAPVGSYLPNAWGLHDVYGNVWEQTDTQVLCGGSWISPPSYCRATARKPALKFPANYVGLRLVLRTVDSDRKTATHGVP